MTDAEIIERLRVLYSPEPGRKYDPFDIPPELSGVFLHIFKRTRETRMLLGIPLPDEDRLGGVIEQLERKCENSGPTDG